MVILGLLSENQKTPLNREVSPMDFRTLVKKYCGLGQVGFPAKLLRFP